MSAINIPFPFYVMLVDDNLEQRSTLEAILFSIPGHYRVSLFSTAEEAVEALRGNVLQFHILFCGLPYSDDQARALVAVANTEFNMPVLVTISNCTNELCYRWIIVGASHCIPKPIVEPQTIRDCWHHVIIRVRNHVIGQLRRIIPLGGGEPGELPLAIGEGGSIPLGGGGPREVPLAIGGEGSSSQPPNPKSPRFVWNEEYQNIFLEAIESIKPERPVPSRILEFMVHRGVPNITREIVKSRLQRQQNIEGLADDQPDLDLNL